MIVNTCWCGKPLKQKTLDKVKISVCEDILNDTDHPERLKETFAAIQAGSSIGPDIHTSNAVEG